MPSRSDIERFKTILNSLGSEPEIRARKQETIEEVAPPAEGLPPDLSQLLDSLAGGETATEEAISPDLSALDEVIAPKKPAKALESDEFPDLDFTSLFGEEKEPESLEKPKPVPKRAAKTAESRPKETPRRMPKPMPRTPPVAEAAPPEPAVEEQALDLGDIASLADLNEMETLGENAAPAEEAEKGELSGEESASPGEGMPLEFPEGGLAMPEESGLEISDASTDAAIEAPVEEVSEQLPEGAADLSSLEDLDLAGLETDETPAPGTSGETIEEVPGAAPGAATDAAPGAATDAAPSEEAFEIPEGESFEAPAAEAPAEELGAITDEGLGAIAEEVPGAASGEAPGEEAFEIPEGESFEVPATEAPAEELGEITDAALGAAAEEIPGAATDAAPGAAPGEAPGEEAFEIPEGESFEVPAAEAEAPAEELGEITDAALGAAAEEIPGAATGEAPGEEAFEIPEGESFEAPAAEAPAEELGAITDEGLGAIAEEVPGAASGEAPGEEAFEIPEGESFEVPATEAEAPAEEEAEPSIDEMQLDEFSLPETVEQFGVSEKKEKPGKVREAAPSVEPSEEAEELGGAELDLRISNEDFTAFQKCLASLPRNLKIEVEEVIAAAKGTPADLKRLVGMLIAGAGIEQIAGLTGKIAGHKIKLPPVVAKMTGVAFEAQKRTFAYAFRENVLPILRIVLLAAAALSGLAFLGFRFVYTPLLAQSRYQRGLAHAEAGRYPQAEQDFTFATGQWRMKPWFYRYADAYRNREEFASAEGKYEELLKWWPGDKKAILDYARMKSVDQRDFRKADSLLNLILEDSMYDPDALLAAGDNQMEWALEDRKHYENARGAYADYVAKNGENDAILQRMLRWFIRTNNAAEADELRAVLMGQKGLKVMPDVWAELGGYLMDEGMDEYVKEVLFRALDADKRLPETYWNLSRYFRSVKDIGEEEKAVREAVRLLEGMAKEKKPVSEARAVMRIEGQTRLGEILFQTERKMEAEKQFQEAIRQTETLRRGRRLPAREAFGKPYADLGDFHFYETRNLDQAFNLYESARANGYEAMDMRYRLATILYRRENFTKALLEFLRLADAAPQNNNLLYAAGNALWFKNDLYSAQGFYLRLRDNLLARKNSIADLSPQEQPEHRALLEFLMRTENNLGATLSRLADRNADRRKRSEALIYLAEATEIWDILSRNPDTLKRSEAQKLPFLNSQAILRPQSRYEVMIYRDIPPDLDSREF